MWKSILDSVAEGFAMCDPVAYWHYLEGKRGTAGQATVTSFDNSADRCVDEWVALSDRLGLWRDNEDAGAHRHRSETPA